MNRTKQTMQLGASFSARGFHKACQQTAKCGMYLYLGRPKGAVQLPLHILAFYTPPKLRRGKADRSRQDAG